MSNTPEANAQREYAAIFTSNVPLDELVKRLVTTEVNIEQVLTRLRYPAFLYFRYNPKLLVGTVLELHLARVLEEASTANNNIVLNPIRPGTKTECFVFHRGRRSTNTIVAARKQIQEDGRIFLQDYTEYDRVLVVDNLPVVIEAKMVHRSYKEFKVALRPQTVNAKLQPIIELFGEHIGYVVLSSRTVVRPQVSSLQANFLAHGGILCAIPIKHEPFTKQVKRVYQQLMFS